LARSYLPYTQGVLSKMHFDTSTAYLNATFTYNGESKDAETSVYLNQEYWYPNGYKVYVKHENETAKVFESKNVDGNYFSVNVGLISDAVKDGDQFTITVHAN